MNIAIPLENGRLSSHFGHCERFAFVEIDDATKQIKRRVEVVPPPHAPGQLPPWLAAQGATIVIAGGMGGRARELLEAAGIGVIVGAPPLTLEELIASYLAGTLEGGSNACTHTEGQACGDDHGHSSKPGACK